MPMEDYLAAQVDYNMARQEKYCEQLEENCGDDDDVESCMAENDQTGKCVDVEDGDDNGGYQCDQFNMGDYVDGCTFFDENYYIGPMCGNDGSEVRCPTSIFELCRDVRFHFLCLTHPTPSLHFYISLVPTHTG